MFVTTFYSFKGGVGRSMSLMNVACEQAKRSKTLVVDFDLEAPGLTTFAPCRSAHGKSGLVEYLLEYRENNIAPRAEDFIYPCVTPSFGVSDSARPHGEEISIRGGLHIMPAGNMQTAYGSKFGQINWEDLYENRDGFLLIEDLKAQWRALGFEYVFVDSRTGHTDSSGICTRQLPDVLVALFSPNEQNLLGLKSILDEVRSDAALRSIERQYIFVASRLPQLDDEHGLLEKMLSRFQGALGYDSENFCEVHNYDSLALVDQEVFVWARPRTRLANEYRVLTQMLVSRNLDDAQGASAYIDKVARRKDNLGAYDQDQRMLEAIGERHSSNPELMSQLAAVYFQRRDFELATAAIDAASSGLKVLAQDRFFPANVLGLRLRIYRASGNLPEAIRTALSCLELEVAPRVVLVDALRTIIESRPHVLAQPENVRVFREIPFLTLIETATAMNFNRVGSQYGAAMLRYGLDAHKEADRSRLSLSVVLTLIAGGLFGEAYNTLQEMALNKLGFATSLPYLFNVTMADWGRRGRPDTELVRRVAKRFDTADASDISELDPPNLHQCMALAFALLNEQGRARELLAEARRSMGTRLSSFSCWSYQPTNRSTFEEHCSEIAGLIDGEDRQPLFITENHHATFH